MEKKLLVAVDGSPSSRRALDYLVMMSSGAVSGLSVTLLNVVKPVPPPFSQGTERDPVSLRLAETMQRHRRAQGTEVLTEAKMRLEESGLDPEKVATKIDSRGLGLARGILFEAEKGMFDAVVLGRRGLSKLEETFVGSVTNKVVQHADRIPVWVVGGRVKSRRILLAVDDSEGSMRAVDHLAFMLEGNADWDITLFHVSPHRVGLIPSMLEPGDYQLLTDRIFREDLYHIERFHEEALAALAERGLERTRVETVACEPGGAIWRTIIKEVENGKYGTVVMGRRGGGQAHFLGHVSDKVLGHCPEAAVWIVG